MPRSLRSLFNRRSGKKAALRIRRPEQRWRPHLECLEDRTLLSISFSGAGSSGVATLTGTAGQDQFVVQLKSGDATTIEFSDSGGASFTDAALSGITGVVVNGLNGRDFLTLDNSNGLIGKSTSLPISFDGGLGPATLVLVGQPGGTVTETFTMGSTAHSGTLQVGNGTVSTSISLTNVFAIVDTLTADTLTLNANDNNNVIHVRNDRSVNGFTTNTVRGEDDGQLDDAPQGASGASSGLNANQTVDQANAAFLPVTFANKTHVVINGLGGDDLFVLSVSRPATGWQSLALDGGSGTNVLVGRQLPSGVSLTLTNIQRTDQDDASAFIDEVYQERLQRNAEDAGLAAWKNVLASAGQAAVVTGIDESLEARMNFMRHLYQRFLGRNPQNGEDLGWVNALASETEEQVLTQFLASAEFYNLAQKLVSSGTPDERFIQAMYQLVLNRQASSTEVSQWENALPTLGRAGVAAAFVESAEFRTDMVTALYNTVLQRDPDAVGLSAWVFSGMDLRHIREGIESSPEALTSG
jgi:Domain of unknown function (DUF4214)